MARAYDYLADKFEELNDDCDYSVWSQYFLKGLSAFRAGENGLELGCGSGAFARALCRAGYRMSGADVSQAMLSKAEQLARSEELKIKFFQADAAKLQTPEKYDFIISPNDCMNYLPQNRLKSAFLHMARALVKGGLLWFDVSSPYKLYEKVANNIFADDREDVTYLCFNHQIENRIIMDVTLFIKRKDGAFDRFDERHIQYVHEEENVLSALNEAGFEVLKTEGHLGEEKERSDRLNFICRKR